MTILVITFVHITCNGYVIVYKQFLSTSPRHFPSGRSLASSSPALNHPPWYATLYLTDHVRKQMRLRLDSTVILDYHKSFVRTNGYLGFKAGVVSRRSVRAKTANRRSNDRTHCRVHSER